VLRRPSLPTYSPEQGGTHLPNGRRSGARAGRRCDGAEDVLTAPNISDPQGQRTQARIDQSDRLACTESERAVDQAKSAYEQAVNGYKKENAAISRTKVEKATPNPERAVDHRSNRGSARSP